MRWKISAILLLCLPLFEAAARPYLKIQQVRSLDYPFVKVEVSVAKITPVLNLNRTDFRLYENGWQISAFQVKSGKEIEEPKHIGLLIDSSRSITPEKFFKQIQAVKHFIENTKSGDFIAIVSFNDRVKTHCAFTSDRAQLAECIGEIKQSGKNTVLHDAIFEGLSLASRLHEARRSLVVFTDGKDEGSVIEMTDLISLAEKNMTPVFIAGTGEKSRLKSLARLSRLSGGETYHTPLVSDIRNIYILINQLLENTYILQYMSQASQTAPEGRKVNLEVQLIGEKTSMDSKQHSFQDQDTYTYFIPEFVVTDWWRRILKDERYLLFAAGFIIILLLAVVVIISFRKSNISVNLAPEAPAPAKAAGNEADFLEKPLVVENHETIRASFPAPEAPDFFPHKKSLIDRKNVPVDYYQAYLVEKEGPRTGKKYRINWDTVTIGHGDENSIVIEDRTVSVRHARIQRKGARFVLYDLLSDHGTWLNGKKLLRPQQLNDFDEIQLGRTKLIFRRSGTV